MNQHTEHSTFREKLIEHIFVGELLKISWLQGNCSLEIASPEVDNSGYDVIAEDHQIVRHIQIKASVIGGKTTRQKVHTRLADKPSGCVIWIYFDATTLAIGPFLFFGGSPGERLPSLDDARVARHSKGNQFGHKAERPNIRVLNKGQFVRSETIEDVYVALFGDQNS